MMRKKRDIEAAIGAADPRRRARVRPEVAHESKRELLEAIVRQPQEAVPDGKGRDGRRFVLQRSTLRRRSAQLTLAGALTALAALGLGVGGISIGPAGPPPTAEGAGLARLAQGSPHLVVALPGWGIELAEQSKDRAGSIVFVNRAKTKRSYLGGRVQMLKRKQIELEWNDLGSGPPRSNVTGLRPIGTGSVLGAAARIYENDSAGLARFFGTYFRAVWRQDGRRIAVGFAAPNRKAFERRLGALREIPAAAWVRSLPGNVVSHGPAVRAGELADAEIALRCRGPLSGAQTAGEPTFVVAYYEKECSPYFGASD